MRSFSPQSMRVGALLRYARRFSPRSGMGQRNFPAAVRSCIRSAANDAFSRELASKSAGDKLIELVADDQRLSPNSLSVIDNRSATGSESRQVPAGAAITSLST